MLASLTHHEITVMLLSLGVLLLTSRIMGELAQWMKQPSVVGEILAGVLLGPTVLGNLSPGLKESLFPDTGANALVFEGFTTLAIMLFLLVAGMEVDLSTIWRQGGTALKIGVCGVVVPFALGFIVAWLLPGVLGRQVGADATVFSLFFATAVSISALPIVVKILMDLNLYRSDFGMIVVASSVLNDLIGWMVFALILGMAGGEHAAGIPVAGTIVLTLLFAALVLTVGRWLFHRILPWLQVYTHWPGGVLAFAMSAAFFSAAFTEWIGVHAILGSFLVGVAIGDSSHLREQTRATLEQFISFIFAPLFFASIGLKVDFIASFDIRIVLVVLLTTVIGKFGGCLFGARWGRLPIREARAVSFSMISVGAMGIIIGLLALDYGLIRQPLFVALVVMALLTSMASGPLVQWSLGRRKPRTAVDLLTSKNFLPTLHATRRGDVIRELVRHACNGTTTDPDIATAEVLAREETMHTGIGNGVALPHARLAELAAPVVALGLSETGVDFDAPDGLPAHAVFLILTPVDDNGEQLAIMASLARAFRKPATLDQVRGASTFTEVLAVLKSASSDGHGAETTTPTLEPKS